MKAELKYFIMISPTLLGKLKKSRAIRIYICIMHVLLEFVKLFGLILWILAFCGKNNEYLYIHFWTNNFGKGMNPFIPPAIG